MLQRNRLLTRLLPNSRLLSPTSNQPFSTSPPPNLKKLYQKDWLSPRQMVEIFTSAEPSSLLTHLNHVSTRKDYKPNESLYSLLITKLGQARNFDAIDNLLAEIKLSKRCRLSDEFFYNVIKVYGNVGGRINKAMETLFDMPKYDCWPSVKTFNFVLNLLVCNKQFDVVREVYLSGVKMGVEIDSCSLNIIIKGHCGSGSFESALQVLDEFPQLNCKPNERTFATIMDGLCENGKVDDAFELLKKMDMEGVWPDTITFNTLIKGLRKRGRVDDAVKVLKQMEYRGCKANSGSLQQVLYGLIEAGRSREAKRMMDRMVEKGWRPSFDSFKMLFVLLCECGLFEDADWVLKEMVRHGFVPRMGMWLKAFQKMPIEISSVNSFV